MKDALCENKVKYIAQESPIHEDEGSVLQITSFRQFLKLLLSCRNAYWNKL